MNQEPGARRRRSQSHSSADTVRVSLPYPKPGETVETEFPRYGIFVIIERRAVESQQDLRGRFVLTAPVGNDNRTHATRMGAGVDRPKKMGVTLCTESTPTAKASGSRITGLELEQVTCYRCRTLLTEAGVVLANATTEKGEGS